MMYNSGPCLFKKIVEINSDLFFICRKYTNGSVLRMHVDTVNTHVVSAIINVDQQLDYEVCVCVSQMLDSVSSLQFCVRV